MKRCAFLMAALLLTGLVTGCGAEKSSGTDASLPSLKLSEELANERMELSSLPWFSPAEDARALFDLQPNAYAVRQLRYAEPQEGVEGYPQSKSLYGLQLSFPVYLEDLETGAVLTLQYRYAYDRLESAGVLETALTDLWFTTFLPDDGAKNAYKEKLQALCSELEQAFPEVYTDLFQEQEAFYRVMGSSTFLEENTEDRLSTTISCDPVSAVGMGCREGKLLKLSVSAREDLAVGEEEQPEVEVNWW